MYVVFMLANYLINKLLKLQFVSGFGGYDALSNPAPVTGVHYLFVFV